jgi:hypothetical protein
MYKQALSTYLKKETLMGIVDSMAAQVWQAGLPLADSLKVDTSVIAIKKFIQNRTASLEKQLNGIPTRFPSMKQRQTGRPCFLTSRGSLLHIVNTSAAPVICNLYRPDGRSIPLRIIPAQSQRSFPAPSRGILMYTLREVGGESLTRGILTVR